jgi:hypothetical protein
MGFFSRRSPDPQRELAEAIGKRGLGARAEIEAARATGATRHDGVGRELELTLSFTTREGASVRAVVRQYFNDLTAVGMDAGEAAQIMYDREDPQRVVVMSSARYRILDGQIVEVVDPHRRATEP